jgi:hypothetical protein
VAAAVVLVSTEAVTAVVAVAEQFYKPSKNLL